MQAAGKIELCVMDYLDEFQILCRSQSRSIGCRALILLGKTVVPTY